MKEYEVIREIMNACAGKWKFDRNFKDEWEAESPEELVRSFYHGNMPPHELYVTDDGTHIYTIEQDLREKYTITEI